MRCLLAPLLTSVTLAGPGLLAPAVAHAAASGSPYSVHVPAEVSVTVSAGAAIILLPRLIPARELAEPPCGGICDPQDIVLPFDRGVADNYSAAAARASDITVGALIVGALGGSLLDGAVSGRDDLAAGWGRDLLVAAEVLLLAEGLAQGVKYLVRRPRPYAYNLIVPVTRRRARQANLSFFSGHAALAFGGAAVLSYTTWSRHPDSDAARGLVLGLTLATASATAYLRVASGRHFWSDVIVGAVVGGGLGVLIPALHDRGGTEQGDGAVQAVHLPPIGFAF